MQLRCAFSFPDLMQIKPAVKRIVAVPFKQALRVGNDSVKDISGLSG
jgi:hypothetical protein